MGSEWPTCSLKEIGVQLIDCDHKTPKAQESGFPYIGIPQMKNGNIDFDADPRLITETDLVTWTRKAKPQTHDVILSRRCNPGETAYVGARTEFALGQNLVLLRAADERVFPPYLRWVVRSHQWWAEISKYLNPGAVFDSLKCADIPKFEVPFPPLPEQKAIAHILGTLDDKIELNRRMNATLEGMAQALFKSWFVDFDPVIDNALAAGNPIPDELAPRAEVRKNALANGTTQQGSVDHPTLSDPKSLFPDAFEFTEELGWIPEGWEEKKIEDCITRFSPGKKYSQKTAEELGRVPILDQGKSGIIGYHNDEPGVKASTDDPIIVFANHTCYMRLIQFDFSAIQNVLPYKGDGLNIYWIYEATKGRQDFIEYKGHWPDFVLNRIVVPSIELVEVFGEATEANYRKIYANTLENEALTKLRDSLLPKLISGDLRIPNKEQ